MKEIEHILRARDCLILSEDEDKRLRREFKSGFAEQKLSSSELRKIWQQMANEEYANFPPIQVDTIEKLMENEQNNEKGECNK